MVHTYLARRRLEMAPDVWREPGDMVPEAHTWRLIESYLNTGYLSETDVDEDEFRAAVATYCPAETDRVLELAGVTAALDGPRGTPRVTVTKTTTKKPAKGATKEG